MPEAYTRFIIAPSVSLLPLLFSVDHRKKRRKLGVEDTRGSSTLNPIDESFKERARALRRQKGTERQRAQKEASRKAKFAKKAEAKKLPSDVPL